MQFTADISTPKNTTESNPKSTTLKCSGGIIHQIDIAFPPGPQDKLFVRCYDEGHAFAPSTEDMNFHADDETITFKEHYKIKSAEKAIKIRTWNTDVYHKHNIHIRVYILPEWVLLPQIVLGKLLSGLWSMFT